MSRRGRSMAIMLVALGGALVTAAVVLGIIFDGYQVPSEANAPTLDPGDRVLVRPVSGDDVGPGDLVVYLAPGEPADRSLQRVGRVVAVGGVSVGSDDGAVLVDGVPLEESYLPVAMQTSGLETLTVPPDHLLILGDNRPNSQDSRFFGPVPTGNVSGVVVARWWPPGAIGRP